MIPRGNLRGFAQDAATLEEAYGLPTQGRAISDIPEAEFRKLGGELLLGLGRIEGIPDFYPVEVVEKIRRGHIVSFAPTVWMTAALMVLETVKVLLSWGRLALGPDFTLCDPFRLRIPKAAGVPTLVDGAGI